MKKKRLDELRHSRTIAAIYNYKINRVKRKGEFIGKQTMRTVIGKIKEKKRNVEKIKQSCGSGSVDLVRQSQIFFMSMIKSDKGYLKYIKEQDKRRIARKSNSMIDLRNKVSVMRSMNFKAKLDYIDDVVAGAVKKKEGCQFEKTGENEKSYLRNFKGFRRLKKVVSVGEKSLFKARSPQSHIKKMARTATEKGFRIEKSEPKRNLKGSMTQEISHLDFKHKKRKSLKNLKLTFRSQNKKKSKRRNSKSVLFNPGVSFNYKTFMIGKKKAWEMKERNKVRTNFEIIDDEKPQNMTIKKFRKAQVSKMKEIFLKSYKRKVKKQSDNYKISLGIEKKKMKMFQDTLSKRNISLTKGRREMKAYLVKSSFQKQSKKEADDYKDYAKKFKAEFEGYMDMVGIGAVSQYRKSKFQKFLRFHKGLVHGYRFVDNPDYNEIDLDGLRQFKDFTKEGDVERMIGGFK